LSKLTCPCMCLCNLDALFCTMCIFLSYCIFLPGPHSAGYCNSTVSLGLNFSLSKFLGYSISI
jgi:hypothetical protein